MAEYTNSINGVALSTSADLRTVVTTATGQGSVVMLSEISLSGEAASSSFARVVLNRPGTAGITPTTGTISKKHPASVNAAFSVATTWGTQPVLSADDLLIPAFNAFGGVYRWLAPPKGEVVVGSQGAIANLSIRSRSGTPVVSGHIVIEEA